MHADWYNMSTTKKQNYIGLLKLIASDFMKDGKDLPWMEVHVVGKPVARSEVTDSNKVKLLK